MYSIALYKHCRLSVLVGNLPDIIALANILESAKIKFKVTDVRGFRLSDDDAGVGGFEYWLEPPDKFIENGINQ